jgi:tetratricopeptide (TPR) repeat protein
MRHVAPPTAVAPASSAQLAASITAATQRAEHEPDARIRSELADAALRDADACIQAQPQAVACLYGRGIALGLQAKTHATRALALLGEMLDSLARAEVADPNYDEAGAARVQALVLIRAPGWPLGPGDPDRGLAAALRAVALHPEYPPNLLALAEAQIKIGAPNDAQASYQRARDTASNLPDSTDRAQWLREAGRGLSPTP